MGAIVEGWRYRSKNVLVQFIPTISGLQILLQQKFFKKIASAAHVLFCSCHIKKERERERVGKRNKHLLSQALSWNSQHEQKYNDHITLGCLRFCLASIVLVCSRHEDVMRTAVGIVSHTWQRFNCPHCPLKIKGDKWIHSWKTKSTMCDNQSCTELKMQDKSGDYSLL